MAKWIYNGVEFKVGDRVKVVRKVASFAHHGMGNDLEWDNSWVEPEMCSELGVTGKVTPISRRGVCVNELGFGYPLAALEKVVQTTDPTEQQSFKFTNHLATYVVTKQGDGDYKITWSERGVLFQRIYRPDEVIRGFLSSDTFSERVAKEIRTQEIEKQLENLTNEINNLRGELAQ
jgi:hypothetical protein